MKKKAAVIVPVCIASVVLIALIAVGVHFVKPLINIGKILAPKGEDTAPSVSEEVGAVDGETEDASEGTLPGGNDGTYTSSQDKTNNASSSENSGAVQATDNKPEPSSSQTAEPSKPVASTSNNNVTPSQGTTVVITTQPASNQGTVQTPSGTDEYEIYRSGHFYAKGQTTDSKGTVTPLELAVTDSTIYMLSQLDGINISILVSGKKTYMICEDKKKYCELNSVLMNAADLDPDEMIATAKESYSDLQPLSKATRIGEENVNGTVCKTYHLRNDEGELTKIYMNGNKLVRIAYYDSKGSAASTIDFTSITSDVPANRTAPAKDYKKQNMITFMLELSEDMGITLE